MAAVNDAIVFALVWSFRHFKAADEANAAIHCATVRYSPITFRLAEALDGLDDVSFDDDDRALERVGEVLDHVGRYAEDTGR